MSFTISAFNHAEWQRHGLDDFSDFAECINEINVGEDAFSGYGEWFYVPDEPLPSGDRVIYYGSWGNDNSPGASLYTHATLFDVTSEEGLADFAERVRDLEAQPEHDDQFEPDDQP